MTKELHENLSDLYMSYRFVRDLTTPWTDTEAYHLGLIDDKGKKLKLRKNYTPAERSAITPWHNLVYNIKRLIELMPGGSSKLATMATAYLLIKEAYVYPLIEEEVLKYINDISEDENDEPSNVTAGIAKLDKPLFMKRREDDEDDEDAEDEDNDEDEEHHS